MHKSLVAAGTIVAVIDGAVAFGIVLWTVLSQIAPVVPQLTSGWQTIGFLALAGLYGYGMWIQNERDKAQLKRDEIQAAETKATQNKVDNVHIMLNSELSKWKEDFKLATSKESDAKIALLEAKMTALEVKLDTEKSKAAILAGIPSENDPQLRTASATERIATAAEVSTKLVSPIERQLGPGERLEEIRGHKL